MDDPLFKFINTPLTACVSLIWIWIIKNRMLLQQRSAVCMPFIT